MIGRLAAAGILAAGLAACGGSSSATPTTASCAAGSAAVNQGSPANTVQATDNLAFAPTTITVSVGQVLQWKNGGGIMHTVTFNDNAMSCLDDAQLNGGSTWDVTFNTAGTYAYHCTIHEQMTGTVKVQ
ncbi:MAG: cupredoxin domain-containing protein [Candidatus Dormibacteria bacterium]